jgi:hypothetical protein
MVDAGLIFSCTGGDADRRRRYQHTRPFGAALMPIGT